MLWLCLVSAVISVWLSNSVLSRYNRQRTESSWFARWAGMTGTMGIGGFIAASLIYRTSQQKIGAAQVPVYELTVVFIVLIVLGISWCFYRAMIKPQSPFEPQLPEEIGDEDQLQRT